MRKQIEFIVLLFIIMNIFPVESVIEIKFERNIKNSGGLLSKIRVKREWSYPPQSIRETVDGGTFTRTKIVTIKSDASSVTNYALEPSDAVNEGIFSITNVIAGGEIWQERGVDRESRLQYTLTALALDSSGGQVENPVPITINVGDENDNPPIFQSETLQGSVLESANIGDNFMQIYATDADSKTVNDNGVVRFEYVGSEDPSAPAPRFSVSDNGVVTLVGSLDRETVPTITFLVVAKDGTPTGLGHRVTGTATVKVLDANDFAPEFVGAPYSTEVGELLDVTSTVFTVKATDKDEGMNKEVYFKISGDPGGYFEVKSKPSSTDIDSMGDIILAKKLDYETGTNQFTLIITAYNKNAINADSLTTTTTLDIRVTDENEAPEFIGAPYKGYVRENNPSGAITNIVRVNAEDYDFGGTQTVTYSLENNEKGWFSIDKNGGEVTAVNPADRESSPPVNSTNSIYTLKVKAIDNDPTNPKSSYAYINIEIGDVNDNAPEPGRTGWTAIVCEKLNPKFDPANITTLSVKDKDSPANGPPFAAKFVNEEDANMFFIEPMQTDMFKVLTVLREFNIAEKSKYLMPIELTDSTNIEGEVVMTSTHTLTLSICSCNSNYEFQCEIREVAIGGFPVAAVVGVIVLILLILIAVLAAVAYKRRNKVELEKQALFFDDDDVRENLQAYHDEGGGEEDNDGYDISALQAPPLPHPKRQDEPPQGGAVPQPRSKIPPDTDIGDYINDAKQITDNDPTAPPFDSLLVFDYEGQGSDAGSLSSLNSGTTDGSQDYDYLNNWGPRFKKLADMYGGGESD